MRILIFGAEGQVARTLVEEAGAEHDAAALGRARADLMTPGAAEHAIKTNAPDAIINAAAYTAVDAAEEDRQAAMQVNAHAVREMAQAAKAQRALFIHVSTDYVFDGIDKHAYKETDATSALNVYGETKRAGEIAALAANDASIILRTSWVFSEFGGNFVKSMLRFGAEKSEMRIVDDQIGGPTSARDIARAIFAIAEQKHKGAAGKGVYHYQGAPAASWAEFAETIFEYANLPTVVKRIQTKEYPLPAARPLNTVLDCTRIEQTFGISQPDWRGSLRQTIAALKGK